MEWHKQIFKKKTFVNGKHKHIFMKKASKNVKQIQMMRSLYVRKIINLTSWQIWPSASIFECRQRGRGFKSHKERKEMEAGSFEARAWAGVGVGDVVGGGGEASHGIFGVGE